MVFSQPLEVFLILVRNKSTVEAVAMAVASSQGVLFRNSYLGALGALVKQPTGSTRFMI